MNSMNKVYKTYTQITKELLDSIKVGDLIKCNNWRQPLKVTAISKNYFIMVRNSFGQALYSICEKKPSTWSRNNFTKGSFRIGTDNWLFGHYDYLTQEGCDEAINDFENGKTELSVRTTCDLETIQIKNAKEKA